MDLLLAQAVDHGQSLIQIGQIVSQVGTTAVLAYMWKVARDDRKEEREAREKAEERADVILKERVAEQAALLKLTLEKLNRRHQVSGHHHDYKNCNDGGSCMDCKAQEQAEELRRRVYEKVRQRPPTQAVREKIAQVIRKGIGPAPAMFLLAIMLTACGLDSRSLAAVDHAIKGCDNLIRAADSTPNEKETGIVCKDALLAVKYWSGDLDKLPPDTAERLDKIEKASEPQ